ncbi:MAG TPA: AzlC family ABC transporter permease [Burkholderiales bacterium]|jgi:4-azaleucine resistance transporter AzlC|nr:AzlC family ABC transporter permease [Burkholderiales bacterium]
MPSSRIAFLAGLRDVVPLLVGAAPFGVIYGVLAVEAGIAPAAAQFMSLVVFAGSAQLIAVQLTSAGASGVVIVLSVFIVNLRHALYSASLAPHTRALPRSWKWLLSYLLTDEAYAVAINRYREQADQSNNHWYFLGAGLALWTTWQVATAAGIVLGTEIPAGWSLDFALPLTFIAIVAPGLRTRADLAAALVGGIVALLAWALPYKLGLIAAALAGITAGLLVARRG